MIDAQFTGKNGFIWFFGIVEDRQDPLKLGRVKVRIFGFHNPSKDLVSTESLPWATTVLPSNTSAMSGIGETPVGPLEGTQVFGFFKDSIASQEPIILGVVPGIYETKPDTELGFADPNGIYPIEEKLHDVNRIARGDTTLKTFKDENKIAVVKSTPIDDTGTSIEDTWEEKTNITPSVYPYNNIKETESGHLEELDDTPGLERTHKMHRSGTFEEIHPDGSKVTKIYGDDYEIVLNNKNVAISGNCSITINGDASVFVNGNMSSEVQGNVTEKIAGNYTKVVYGNSVEHIKGTNTRITDGALIEHANSISSYSIGTALLRAGTIYSQATGNNEMIGASVHYNKDFSRAEFYIPSALINNVLKTDIITPTDLLTKKNIGVTTARIDDIPAEQEE